jgi:hypothetical protein
MLGKTKLVAIITILVTSVGLSNLAYAHVDVCAGSDNGKPFNEIWTAICDLQSQIDNFEKKHNDQLVNVGIKRVQLTDEPCISDSTYLVPVGWCLSSGSNKYLIKDSSLTDKSVVSISILLPQGSSNNPTSCRVDSINYVEGQYSGFLVACDSIPPPTTKLNYIIFFDYAPIPVGTTPSPPVGGINTPGGTTNSPHDDDSKCKNHDNNDKCKNHDDNDKK